MISVTTCYADVKKRHEKPYVLSHWRGVSSALKFVNVVISRLNHTEPSRTRFFVTLEKKPFSGPAFVYHVTKSSFQLES